MGTYAGIDLLTKIANNTEARSDQDHLSVIMISEPSSIDDRTDYLVDRVSDNPGYAIKRIAERLSAAGASRIGIPCNTAHVPEILDIVTNGFVTGIIVNMLDEVGRYISGLKRKIRNVGILGTNGVYITKVYDYYLHRHGFTTVYPEKNIQFET